MIATELHRDERGVLHSDWQTARTLQMNDRAVDNNMQREVRTIDDWSQSV